MVRMGLESREHVVWDGVWGRIDLVAGLTTGREDKREPSGET
jgi:hypothetical protein